jgi:hypothetical protein
MGVIGNTASFVPQQLCNDEPRPSGIVALFVSDVMQSMAFHRETRENRG